MEWREQTSLSCDDAFNEAQRWMEEVTHKSFVGNNFRPALENGVLLCDLMNQLKPGLIRRVNRLSTPIAGLDNVSVFLKACGKLGLNESQLFHPGDLQDLSSRATLRREESKRRLKNVLITIYWLGRKAQADPYYSGPQLNLKAFEGLLGLALVKALEDSSSGGGSTACVRDSGFVEHWFPEREESQHLSQTYLWQDSRDSCDPMESRILRTGSEGCGSDAKAEQVFRMEGSSQKDPGHIPAPLLRQKGGHHEDGRGCPSPLNRSKSQTDVPRGPLPAAGLVRQQSDGMTTAELRAGRTTPKVNEDAKWQDDLTKWKIRRRSTNSDLRKKLNERQHSVGQMAKGGRPSPMPTGALPEKRGQQSPSPSTPAAPSSMPREGCIEFKPRVRGSLARSYATEAYFSPQDSYIAPQHPSQGPYQGAMPALGPTFMGEITHSASLASHGVGATTPTIELPFSSQTQACQAPFSTRSEPGHIRTDRVFTSTMTFLPSSTPHTLNHRNNPSVSDGSTWIRAASHGLKDCAAPTTRPGPLNGLTDPGHQSQPVGEFQKNGCDMTEGRETPDLYRYSTRAGSWSGSASLPRGYRRSEGSARLSAVLTAKPFGSRAPRVASLPRLNSVDKYNTFQLSTESTGPAVYIKVATSKIRGQGQKWVDQEVNEERKEEVDRGSTPVGMTHSHTKGYHPRGQSLSMVPTYCHSPRTSRVSVPPPVEVRHSDMRVSLSLKPNSRSDFGFQTHWDSTGARVKSVQPGSPAEQCQLCVGDEVVAVDSHSVAQLTYDQWKRTMSAALEAGSLAMDIRRYGNKDWASSESGHPNPACQSRKTINLTANASVLIGRTDHHADQPADFPVFEEHAALQPAQLNMKLKTVSSSGLDAGLCDDPLTVTRKGGSESAISDLQVPSISPSSSSNWSWDRDEERRRQERWQEEQERLLQEQYQRDQERLESEWQRAQQEAVKEGYRKSESSIGVTNGFPRPANIPPPAYKVTIETRAEPNRKQSLPQGEEQGEQSDRLAEQDWAGASYGFSQLSAADRTKSQSTPALATLHKQEIRGGALTKRKGRGPVSQEEQERQQILEEMRKRTQLLTDNSWIRQQSASVTKEPLYQGGTMRRYESLDNMHIPSSSLAAYQRPISAAAAASALRCSVGAGLPQRHASWSSNTLPIGREPVGQSQPNAHQPGRAVSGKRTCSVCERSLGRGAAVVIEALGLCFHPACFQCADCRRPLGDYAAGARVRIRKRKPFCEPCYLRRRVTYAPSI